MNVTLCHYQLRMRTTFLEIVRSKSVDNLRAEFGKLSLPSLENVDCGVVDQIPFPPVHTEALLISSDHFSWLITAAARYRCYASVKGESLQSVL